MRAQLSLSTHAQETLCIRHFYKICCAKKKYMPGHYMYTHKKTLFIKHFLQIALRKCSLGGDDINSQSNRDFFAHPMSQNTTLFAEQYIPAGSISSKYILAVYNTFFPKFIWNVYYTCFWPLGFSRSCHLKARLTSNFARGSGCLDCVPSATLLCGHRRGCTAGGCCLRVAALAVILFWDMPLRALNE